MKTLLVILMFASVSHADDRQVVGGDILHSAKSIAKSEDEATFLATQAAIRAIVIECRIAHRDIKIFRKSVVRTSTF